MESNGKDFEYILTDSGVELLRYCGMEKIVRVPERIKDVPVTKIGAYAFSPYLSEFTLDPLEQLEQRVVQRRKEAEHHIQWRKPVEENNIERIDLPDTVEEIGKGAFYQCVNLQEIQLGKKIHMIGERAWQNCERLRSVILPDQITEVRKETFRNCIKLTHVALPEDVRIIDDYAFCNCRDLGNIALPDQVHTIGNHAFYDCRNLKQFSFSGRTETFGDGVFKNCDALERIKIEIPLEEPTRLHVLFSNLENELTLHLNYHKADGSWEQAELFLPGYECEYIGDILSRHFKEVVHGAGRGYIFCVSQPEIDFDAYDGLFLEAQRLDDSIHLIQIALCRLRYPFRLKETYQSQYEAYLKEFSAEAGEFLMHQDDMEGLEFMAEYRLFTDDGLQKLEELACLKNRPEYVGFFMDYGNRQRAASKKTFEFDDLSLEMREKT